MALLGAYGSMAKFFFELYTFKFFYYFKFESKILNPKWFGLARDVWFYGQINSVIIFKNVYFVKFENNILNPKWYCLARDVWFYGQIFFNYL